MHIPKTGGTALTLALEERAARDDIIIGDTPKAKRRKKRLEDLEPAGRLWKHSTLADIDGIVSTDELADMFCTTLVRNPWDRAVSYYHWLRTQGFEHPAVGLAKLLDFNGFMRDPTTVGAFHDWPYGAYMADANGGGAMLSLHTHRASGRRFAALCAALGPWIKHSGCKRIRAGPRLPKIL